MFDCLPTLNVFVCLVARLFVCLCGAVSKAAISPGPREYINLTLQQPQNAQLELLQRYIKFQMISWEVCEKMKQTGFVFYWPYDPSRQQGRRKCYKMLEVNDAYKRGTPETVWLKRVHVMSKVKALPRKTAGRTRLVIQMNMSPTWILKKGGGVLINFFLKAIHALSFGIYIYMIYLWESFRSTG